MRRARAVVEYCVAMVAMMLFTQCQVAPPTVAMADVDMSRWDDAVRVTLHNDDTTSLRAMSLMLHVNQRFTADSLSVEITTMTPDSLRYTERVTLPTNIQQQGTATAIDLEIPYRRDVRLRCQGEYHVMLNPLRAVEGVEAAGINFQTTR